MSLPLSGGALDDLGALALFARVVQLRSFTAAADELGVAKSAVSRRVAGLERRIGARLLARSTRRVVPTPEGMLLYGHCARLLDAARDATAGMRAAGAGETGTIRVNAPGLFAQLHVAPLLPAFLRAHPGVAVDLRVDDAVLDLFEGRFDVTLRIARAVSEGAAVARRIGADRLGVWAAPSYLATHGTPRDPADLPGHECLQHAPGGRGSPWQFGSGRQPVEVPVRSRVSAGDDGTLKCAALAGAGLAILPRGFVLQELSTGALVEVLPGRLWQPARGVFAVLPEWRLAPRRVKALVAFLERHLRLEGAR